MLKISVIFISFPWEISCEVEALKSLRTKEIMLGIYTNLQRSREYSEERIQILQSHIKKSELNYPKLLEDELREMYDKE